MTMPSESETINEQVACWNLEIRRILNGEREGKIARQMSADGYVEQSLVLSKDPTLATTAFHIALRQVVATWGPHTSSPSALRETYHLLSIINSYRPENGFAVVTRLVESGRLVGRKLETYIPGELDLHRLALDCLCSYCPDTLAPHFERYKQTLLQQINQPKFASYREYAVARLLEMEPLHKNLDLVFYTLRQGIESLELWIRCIMYRYRTTSRRPEDALANLKNELALLLDTCLKALRDMPRSWALFMEGMGEYRIVINGPKFYVKDLNEVVGGVDSKSDSSPFPEITEVINRHSSKGQQATPDTMEHSNECNTSYAHATSAPLGIQSRGNSTSMLTDYSPYMGNGHSSPQTMH